MYSFQKCARTQKTILPKLLKQEKASNYMGLGRSIDSQLGNRMQSIIFYLARLKYGDAKIPNAVLLQVDEDKRTIQVKSYYVKLSDYEKAIKKSKGVFKQNAYRQYIYIEHTDKETVEPEIIKDLNLIDTSRKLHLKDIETFTDVDSKCIQLITDHKKCKTEIDLLIYESDRIRTFEIKLGGGLDTKNAPANIREVEELKKLLLFSQKNNSYFATCYSNGSGALSQSFSSESEYLTQDDKLLKNQEFWDIVLPSNMTYEEFIKKYTSAFKKSKINKLIKELAK